MGLGEPGAAELAPRDDRHRAAEERRVALHDERVGRLAAVGICQRRTLSTSSSTRMRKPTIPCCDGASPVASDVSALAVVDGSDRRDRAARHRLELGERAAVRLDARPPEPVEHQQHDRASRPAPARATRPASAR